MLLLQHVVTLSAIAQAASALSVEADVDLEKDLFRRDCMVGPWTEVKPRVCSRSCGGGSYPLYREIMIAPVNGGLPCPDLTATMPCNIEPCFFFTLSGRSGNE